jgi:hypothetical protein
MPSQPIPSQTPLVLAPHDWALLVKLPRRVLIAATSAERDNAKHTVAEGLAGIEAIAAGRASTSRLVRHVVAAIYAEPDEDAPAAEEFADPDAGIASVLAECRAVARLLSERVPPADAGAYRQWLTDIATTVCAAARSGGVLGFAGTAISPAERRFLDELSRSLGG